MHQSFKRRVSITLAGAVVWGLLAYAGTSVYRFQFTRAVVNYSHNPTPANKAELDIEAGRVQQIKLMSGIGDAVVIFFLANFVWCLVRREGWQAAASLLMACTIVVVRVGIPSYPFDWRCCSYWGPGFGKGVSETAVQLFALAWWFFAFIFLVAMVSHSRWHRVSRSN